MKVKLLGFAAVMLLLTVCPALIQAQTAGSIGGTVTDANGAGVPNATVVINGASGKEFTAVTNGEGIYKVPVVETGVYTITVTAQGFKKSVTTDVKVDVGQPSTVNATLQTGDVKEVVTVAGGGEVLQSETAAVSSTITGRQIIETPIPSRDALDLISLLPGVSTVGRPRQASINGLPKGAVNITIDGVDVQDNLLRSSDGYFTYVRPRVDNLEEVTVNTSNSGADASGDGAVQIKFVTKRGTNDYKGTAYYQHRNEALNSNYWYLNRDHNAGFDDNGHALRQKIRLHQFGANFGGPIITPRFGDGGGSWLKKWEDQAFFFVSYEMFRLPETQGKTRTILTPAAQSGIFSYISGGQTRTVDLYQLAQSKGQLATADPTVAKLLNQIRAGVGQTGSTRLITNNAGVVTDPNRLLYDFAPSAMTVRKFFATRIDVNLTKKHSVEFVMNKQTFDPAKDFLNSQEERFPGLPSYTQSSNRDTYSTTLRSTFGKNVVNEARHSISTGQSFFSSGISVGDYDNQGGYDLGIGAAGITSATSRNSYSDRNSPTYDFTDSVNWIWGGHTINFGGQYKRIKLIQNSIGRMVPTVSFGLDSTIDPNAFNMFCAATSSTCPVITLPGASSTQLTEARNLYATLVGRITAYTTTAYLTDDGTYKINAYRSQNARQDTYGLWAQDSWKIRPNLTLSYGLRWQPQGAFTVLTDNYAALENFDEIYGESGLGNLFKPGTFTGTKTKVVGLAAGDKGFKDDLKNFAPTFGVVYSPGFKGGVLGTIFGGAGKSVLRAGWSRAFVREGTALIGSILGSNPGGTFNASRNTTVGGITGGTNLRDPNNTNLTPNSFPGVPAYPFTLKDAANSANVFDPNLTTGYVDSFSFGYQREIDKNTVVEVRYVGNRGKNLWRQHNLAELNTVENGYAAEFLKAQQNLYLNIAAGKGQTFAYFADVAGSNQLPLTLAYTCTPVLPPNPNPVPCTASVPARYNSTLYTNSTLIAQLSKNNPQVLGFAANIENSLARRTNAGLNGQPCNLFYANCQTLSAGAFVLDNSARSWYDGGVLEVRRRLSNGVRIGASYTFSKAQSDEFQSNSDNFVQFVHRSFGRDLSKNVAVFDIRHQFKFDATWDLPFGKGRTFFGNSNAILNGIVGGWTILPVVRWQSGTPVSFGNVSLVGMTKDELQKEIKVRKGSNAVTFLPDDIILNTQRAFDINVGNATGYGATFEPAPVAGGVAPTGRFLAPAGYGNCQSAYSGQCGFNNLVLYGPSFFKFDATVAKRIAIGEKRSIEFRMAVLDVLNAPNFRVGGFGADVSTSGVGGTTFGQLGAGSAYQDISTTNDPGGRIIDLMLRINF
jgi:hypothetical protein